MSEKNQIRLFRAAPYLGWAIFFVLFLCALPLVALAVDSAIPGLSSLEKGVEWAEKQNIVTLALTVAILALIFAAWLVKMTMGQQLKHWERATNSIEGLRNAMVQVRCPAINVPPPPAAQG